MQLIIKYHIGNGYEETVPALYSSAENLYNDFIEGCEKAFSEKKDSFTVGDFIFDMKYFIYRCYYYSGNTRYVREWPKIMTIDEWFDESKKHKEFVIEEIK